MSARSAVDYATVIRALYPRGRVWPNDPDAQQSIFIAALAQEYAQLDTDAQALRTDIFPATTVNLLPEWEETLGLPDPCLGPSPSLEQRQAQVLARFVGAAGQSVQFFIDYAAALGFEIEITEYAPSIAGRMRAGDPVMGADWAHTWLVDVISGSGAVRLSAFRAGVSRAGDPLASDAVTYPVLECEITALKPAHTQVNYTTP